MSKDSWNPKQYDKFKAERSQPFYDLMNLLEPRQNAQVIDLGCGTGELTADLHRHLNAAKTTGLDSSDEMFKKSEGLSVHGLSFEKGNIDTWSSSKSYDIIFSNAALQWSENHPDLFRRLREGLKPHGQLAVQMPMNFDYPTHLLAQKMSFEEPWASLLKNEKYEKQKTMLTPEEYAGLLFKLGFQEQKVFLRVYGHVLPSREGVIEWVKGTLLTYFQSRLTDSDYQKFLVEFKQRLFLELPDDQPFFYPFKRILLWGKLF